MASALSAAHKTKFKQQNQTVKFRKDDFFMALLLVNIDRGLFGRVYTNSQEPFDVYVVDEDDKNDLNHAGDYAAYEYLVRHGGLKRFREGYNESDSPDTYIFEHPLKRHPDVTDLIAEVFRAKEPDTALQQQLDAAFAAGYLQCVAELNRSLRLEQKSRENISMINQFLTPILTTQYERFLKLVESLNDLGETSPASCDNNAE